MDARPPQWTIFRRTTAEREPPTRPPWTLPGRPGPLAPPRPRSARSRDENGAERRRIAWPSAPRPERSGDVLSGRYELISRIGSGGMGEVYAARFLASRRQVAVKLLDPHLAGDPELVARFRHEYLILTRVAHPHLVRAIDMAVTDDGQPYFTMELIRGETLEQRLTKVGRMGAQETIELGLQLCGATSALHRAGVIHRDIKPTNVLLCDTPAGLDARLIDLGIAWLSPAYYADTDPYMTPPAARVETGRGLLLGTPGYTPPEAGHRRCGPVHDVFALGVLLYRAATGRMPFAAPYGACDGQEPRPFAELGIASPPPAGLEEVLLTALALRPGDRLRDVDELAAELACANEQIDDEVDADDDPPAEVGAPRSSRHAEPRRAAPGRARRPPAHRIETPRPAPLEEPAETRATCSKKQISRDRKAEAPRSGRCAETSGAELRARRGPPHGPERAIQAPHRWPAPEGVPSTSAPQAIAKGPDGQVGPNPPDGTS